MKFHQHISVLPTYEVGKPLELVMRDYNIEPQNIIKLGSNENPLGVSPLAKEAILENACNAYIYPDDSYYELKESLAKKYNVESNQIIIGSGSDQIIEFCIHAICDKNTKVLMAKTTFAMYAIYAKHCNATILRTPDFFHNLDSMLQYYEAHKPSIIFLCTPNNPLGEALPKSQVIDFLKKIDRESLVVLDCAYMEYCAYKDSNYAIRPKDIIGFPNVIYLGTFSKIYGLGGMRVGYGIANKGIIDMLNKIRPPFNITTLSLKAASASLFDEEFLLDSVKNNFSEMEKYKHFAKQYEIDILESYANFVTFILHNKLNSTKISSLLLRQGIVVRDLASYGLNAVRITIGIPQQNDIVIQKLTNILQDL
ncbi:histidinol-phosphate transaminase [Helicobacter bilis]|uniref:histidinol-phosphate transaminase n=1 Tax=Helicobacter bilis TaxID=37372 RepID=UPI0026F0BD08|nr:histidinol-phosphate transaminase [Helicobacter bilis]MCI7410917.1 histidinol-phosphate transaminase [Helicobacter bilis]MDD7295788.1 histidinol-phosphate transaminase [Helicobacter bilis]MDY4399127.1 histidinol-phosphate transaminase [Helicobacter bilis]